MRCSLHGSFLRSGGARAHADRPVADADDGDDDGLEVVVNIRTNLLVLWAPYRREYGGQICIFR